MSQNSLVLPTTGTVSGLSMTQQTNDAINTLATNNSGASAPSTTYAYMLWADTTTGLLKQRNAANSAWIVVGRLASDNLGLTAPVASVSASVAAKALTVALKDAAGSDPSSTNPVVITLAACRIHSGASRFTSATHPSPGSSPSAEK